MKEMSNTFQVRCSGQHTYYLNLTLFIVFDNFNEQLTLINVTLHEQARTVVLKDSIEIKSTSGLYTKFNSYIPSLRTAGTNEVLKFCCIDVKS